MLNLICGAGPWSAADAPVGAYLMTAIFQRIAAAGRGAGCGPGGLPHKSDCSNHSPEKPAFYSPDILNSFAPGGFFITIGGPQAHGTLPLVAAL